MNDHVPSPAAQEACLEDIHLGGLRHYHGSTTPRDPRMDPVDVIQPVVAMTVQQETNPKHEKLRVQARTLFVKNVMYQRRNVGTNLCLLGSPIVFCTLLLLVQVALRKLLTGEDFECGCQCTLCCFNGDKSNCTSVATGVCPYTSTCLKHNKAACGVEYSSPRQAAFCEITHPPSWPSILQVPPEQERAAPYTPRVAFLYTGQNMELARNLTGDLVTKPDFTPARLVAAQRYLNTFESDLQNSSTAVPGELLSLLGFQLGTSSKLLAGLYLETALIGESQTLYTLWPEGTCLDLGLDGAQNISLTTMLQAMSNASNSAGVAAILNSRVEAASMLAGDLGGSNSAYSSKLAAIKLNCTDVVLSKEPDATAMQRSLYCGYWQSACVGIGRTNAYAAGIDWHDTSKTRFSPHLYYNDTYGDNDGSTVYQRSSELLNTAVNSWLRYILGEDYTIELIGVMATPKLPTTVSMDLTISLGPLFFTWVVQMLLPVFLMQLVYEKEKRLRMMMKMHGLGDAAYWMVMYAWFLLLYVAYMAVLVGFAGAVDMDIFSKNDYGIQAALYFLFGNNMIAFAFLLSCFFINSKTAGLFAYMLIFSTGILGSLLLDQLIDAGAWYTMFIEFVPSFALFRGYLELADYASRGSYRDSYGMLASNLHDADNGMTTTWVILAVEWVIFMLVAMYLEQVYASGTGNRRSPLFFLEYIPMRNKLRQPRTSDGLELPTNCPVSAPPLCSTPVLQALGFKAKPEEVSGFGKIPSTIGFMGLGGPARSPLKRPISASPAAAMAGFTEPDDVSCERLRVERLTDYDLHPIVIRQLNKTYPGLDGQPPKLAVRTLDLAIGKGECFGLLGPNGAGKSTTISMLVGLETPSAGTAFISGHDITTDMISIYSLMGVCPQHDLLWDTLSGREHLLFYGRLKGLRGAALEQAVESGLRAVNLWQGGVGNKQAGKYSGGMKRRLSVAISFMGNPKAVYLDEPSTGLDPASRRTLWDVIKKNKPGRAIVLTTHSMEEAETLCDRLGIFVDGRLVCIGEPKGITSRYAGFLVFSLTVPAEQEAAAREMVLAMSPAAKLTYSVGGTLKFELPTTEVSFSRVFSLMTGGKAAAAGLQVLDWGVANATLEEVFIKFARQIGAKGGR